MFVSINQTFPSGATLIARGCVHTVGILYSVTYEFDFAFSTPQNVARCSSGKLSIGVPVFVVSNSTSSGDIVGFGGGNANKIVDVRRIPPKKTTTNIAFLLTANNYHKF